MFLTLSGCASDSLQLKQSRDAYLKDDFSNAESSLYAKEVFQKTENRFVHYSSLASIAMAAGEYEKAIYFLLKARDLVNQLRSSQAGFDWFSKNYTSNGIEYSYLHYFLVMANLLLAEEGKTPAWTTPEVKDRDGTVLIPAQGFPAREFDAKEISDFRTRARAELLAWDSHFNHLKNSSTNGRFYHDDVWARLLASHLHSLSDQNSEKRIGELLAKDAAKLIDQDFKNYPASATSAGPLLDFAKKLEKKNPLSTLFVLEAGVISKYKIKRFHVGLSTLFKGIEDPILRAQMEQIGFRVILELAPEFGLTLFMGGMLGAIGSSNPDDDSIENAPPRFFSDAVDAGVGFQVEFPSLEMPPSNNQITLSLENQSQQKVSSFTLPVVCPLQEIISNDLKAREDSEMFKESVKIGLQYLAILIPAIKTYQEAQQENNFLKRLAAVAGYFMAKKIIDHAHRPDLRSWSYLPQLIAANVIQVPVGTYQAKINIQNDQGTDERALGELKIDPSAHSLIRKRIGEVSILKNNPSFERIKP